MLTTIHCKNCDHLVGESSLFCFYEQTFNSYHLTVKFEKRNEIIKNIRIVEQHKPKERKFKPFLLHCLNEPHCVSQLGTEITIGPNAEAIFCFKADAIYLLIGTNRHNFETKSKWAQNMKSYPQIVLRTIENFYASSNLQIQPKIAKKDFHTTKIPSYNEIIKLNIGALIRDEPRKYQVELYTACLLTNTICYLPTGAGKTLIGAMVAACLKKLNPNKKVYFVTDRVPLVYQQGNYLHYQTGLSTGEFCGQNKELQANQYDYDILVFTVDFLINKLDNRTFFIEDCCCLIFDEIHHAIKGQHSFKRLIESFYKNTKPEYRPRIVGLTASPSSGSSDSDIFSDLKVLSNLIEGNIYMPILYRDEMESIINRPDMKFIETGIDPALDKFIRLVDNFMQPFISYINNCPKSFRLELNTIQNLSTLVKNEKKDSNIQTNQRRFTIVEFLGMIVNSLEIMSILGLDVCVEFIQESLIKQAKNNVKNKIWSKEDLNSMDEFSRKIQDFRGHFSEKLFALVRELKQKNSLNSDKRSIVFVRKRKTARFLVNFLNKDEEIRNYYNPKIFVGHAGGSLDGMEWQSEQHPTLEIFREGNCRLLVSTNVLQEGLDVPVCEKVILFDIVWSLTEFVQSRGRARDCQSEFILIGSAGEEEFYRKLIRSEKRLAQILNTFFDSNHLNRFDIETIYRMIEQTDRRDLYHENLCSKRSNYTKSIRFSLQIFINNEPNEIRNLFDKLKALSGHKQTDLVNDPSLADDEIFSKDENKNIYNSLFELKHNYSVTHNELGTPSLKLQTIRDLLKDDFNCAVSLFQTKCKSTPPILQSMCKSAVFGNLITPFEFVAASLSLSDNNIKFILEYNEKLIQILFFIDKNLYKIEITFDSIDKLCCFDLKKKENKEKEEEFHVYFAFKHNPFVFCLDSKESEAVTNLSQTEEKYLNWERTCKLSSFKMYALKLAFDCKEINHILTGFQFVSTCRVIFLSVQMKRMAYGLENLRNDFKLNDFDSVYALECFISQNDYIIDGKIDRSLAAKLNSLEADFLSDVLERLSQSLQKSRFIRIMTALDKLVSGAKTNESFKQKNQISNQILMVKRATVSPSKIVYHFPEPFTGNRVLRNFNPNYFLRLSFLDENLRKLNSSSNCSDMTSVYHRISSLLRNGLTIRNYRFNFLAMSASQLREHGCWMFSPLDSRNLNADSIRKWMGNFESITNIGKYAARLGQSLSSSIATFETEEFEIIPDLKTNVYDASSENTIEYCFTDGIGKISAAKAAQICANFYNNIYASAFQIRFAGFKGVLAVSPQLTHVAIQFRESMHKFESNHKRLDVLNVAEYIPCFLNRQVIMILSALGIKDSVFSDLQDQMLKRMSRMLFDKKTAADLILKYYRNSFSFIASNSSKINYTLEPFFKSLLVTIHNKQLQGMIHKSRIFVENGRILMGCIDETGSLKENEVFIQCSTLCLYEDSLPYFEKKISQKYFVVKSKIAVAKNPCMHPGDVRVLTAVDVPQLKHMVDCIVFPACGKRPITSMCSGSDLDGDLYWVTWEPLLIPDHVEEPLLYAAPKSKEKTEKISINDIIEFFVNFIEVDQLGRIANMHVALADSSENGVRNPMCIELAKIFSLAVDFPKTGIVPKIPKQIKNTSYPDFMQKNANSYESQKIIGKMYRKCNSIYNSENHSSSIELNKSFLVDGYQIYLSDAQETYAKYRFEIERMKSVFGCRNESELFVGLCLNSNQSDQAKENYKLSTRMIKDMFVLYREIFFKEFSLDPTNHGILPKEAFLKASAWYFSCYSSPDNKKNKIISFPWVVEDVLQNLNKIENSDSLFKSTIENYCKLSRNNQALSLYLENIQIKKEISQTIQHELMIVGSQGLFLFEDISSIDLQLLICSEKFESMASIKQNLDKHYYNVILDKNVVKCQIDDLTSITIFHSVPAISRFIYLSTHIFANPFLLPLFYTVVHFARLSNIFLFLNTEAVKLDLFQEFFLQFCIQNNYIQEEEIVAEQSQFKSRSDDMYFEWLKLHDDLNDFVAGKNQLKLNNNNNSSQILLKFYNEFAFSSEQIVFKSKFETARICLSQKSEELLRNHFFNVFNLLAKSSQMTEVWMLLSESSEPTFRKKFIMAKKRGKSQNIFAENASLLLFSNYKSDSDLLEFNLYKGKRRYLHLNKECYSVSLIRESASDRTHFTSECYNKYLYQCVKQITKAKEFAAGHPDNNFSFQVKFGNFYLTNLPAILLEETYSVSMAKLLEALKKGYKIFKFGFQNDEAKPNTLTVKKDEKILAKDNYESSDEDDCKYKKKKKKKSLSCNAYSAFDSNLSTDLTFLNSLFINNEFDSKTLECYIVYLELRDAITHKLISFRAKYNANFELLRVEALPIKWMSIDVCNLNKDPNNDFPKKDIRYGLLSDKEIKLSVPTNDTVDDNELLNHEDTFRLKLKQCIIRVQNENLNVCEDFRASDVFVRHSKSIKFNGNSENWKLIASMAGIDLPESKWIEKVIVSIIDTNEFVGNDENGNFTVTTDRKEVILTAKLDELKNLNLSEYKELSNIMWLLSHIFSKLLN